MSDDPRTISPSGIWATFRLGGELFAVPVEAVQEVLMAQPLTPVPLAPDHIVGLLNLRGQIMPAVDLRRRLRFAPAPPGAETSLVVLKSRGNMLSLMVDEIGDVMTLPVDAWRTSPDTLSPPHRVFVFGICPIQRHLVLGLRVDALSGEDNPPTSDRATGIHA